MDVLRVQISCNLLMGNVWDVLIIVNHVMLTYHAQIVMMDIFCINKFVKLPVLKALLFQAVHVEVVHPLVQLV